MYRCGTLSRCKILAQGLPWDEPPSTAHMEAQPVPAHVQQLNRDFYCSAPAAHPGTVQPEGEFAHDVSSVQESVPAGQDHAALAQSWSHVTPQGAGSQAWVGSLSHCRGAGPGWLQGSDMQFDRGVAQASTQPGMPRHQYTDQPCNAMASPVTATPSPGTFASTPAPQHVADTVQRFSHAQRPATAAPSPGIQSGAAAPPSVVEASLRHNLATRPTTAAPSRGIGAGRAAPPYVCELAQQVWQIVC